MGGLGGLSVAEEPPAPPPPLQLRPQPALSPPDFQAKWGSLQPSAKFGVQLGPGPLGFIQTAGQQASTQRRAAVSCQMLKKTSRNQAQAVRPCRYSKGTGCSSHMVQKTLSVSIWLCRASASSSRGRVWPRWRPAGSRRTSSFTFTRSRRPAAADFLSKCSSAPQVAVPLSQSKATSLGRP